jgi:sugar/nucleoside kinase (ribokinase family)
MAGSYPRAARPALIVGSIAIDRVETPAGIADKVQGGAASYAAVAASYFAPARLVGVVGGDFPPAFLRRFRRRGIDLAGLKIDAAGRTFYWSGRYNRDFSARETLEVRLNLFENFSPELPDGYRATPFVLLGAIQPALQNRVLDQLKGPRPFIAADTFDLWINTAREELGRLLRRIDLFVINEEEARLLTGEANLFSAGRRLRAMGPRMAVIKKGGNGSVLLHPEGIFAVPACPVKRFVDPTGAGDSFAGALIGYLASVNRSDFASLKRAVAFAAAAASITIESFSLDRLCAAGRRTIDARFSELRRMTRF